MKKIITLSLMLAALALRANAAIWRVNNNTGVQADFTTISAAITAAAAGDTIYIEGSAAEYNESNNIAKRLIIIGTGYYLTDAANLETQWNTNPATVGHFIFAPGSAGSKVSGLYMNSYQYLNDVNITIERCYVNGQVIFGNGSNINCDHDTVRQCVITGQIICQPSGGTFSAQGEMVYNNIIRNSVSFSYGSLGLPNTSVYFINNDFVDNTSFVSENCVYQNNIFFGPTFGSYGTSNYFANNIFSNDSSSSSVPTGNSNQFSINMNTVYVAGNSNPYNIFSSPAAGMSHDGQYQLAAGSPAIGAGDINGTAVDCGAFGGPAPYILSGMPNIPSIYSLTVPAQVNDGTATMNISLSAASH